MASSAVSADAALSDVGLAVLPFFPLLPVDSQRICVYASDREGRPRQACWDACADAFWRLDVPHVFRHSRDRLNELTERFETAREDGVLHILDR